MLDISTVGGLAPPVRQKPAATEETRPGATTAIAARQREAVDDTDAKTEESAAGKTAKAVQQAQRNARLAPDTRLSILFDDGANLFVSRSIENETGEVINQFPPEQAVKRVTALVEKLHAENKPKLSFSA